MPALFASNPLYDRLTRDAKGPSLRACVWLAFGLGVSLTYGLVIPKDGYFRMVPIRVTMLILPILVVAVVLLMLLLPIVAGVVAAMLAAHDAQGKEYQLLVLNNLSPKAITWGYIGATLHQLRLVLALMIGLLPVPVGILRAVPKVIAYTLSVHTLSNPPVAPETASGTANNLIWGSYAGLILIAALLGIILFAASLGVWLGLAWRKATRSAVATVFTIILFESSFFAFIMSLQPENISPTAGILIGLLLAPVPYLLGWGTAQLANLVFLSEKGTA